MDHAARVAAEIEHFRGQADIHALPDIFHYWSNKHLGPHVAEVFGSRNMYEIFSRELRVSIRAAYCPDIVSIGAGDGSVEIAVAERMLADGARDFRIECLELSPHLIARGEAAVRQKGLERHVVFREADLTYWQADKPYGGAFAHHSLHHIEALEHVFDELKLALLPDASFVIADMIGRNGHMRWPETLALIERLWSVMPDRYKYHHLFGRRMETFENWDCSGEGFEGIRAQDILPLLLQRFSFRKFCVWGGVLDMFVDRAFGHNFKTDNADDKAFIDRLWEADCALLRTGSITPTQVLGVLTQKRGELVSSWGVSPAACVRVP